MMLSVYIFGLLPFLLPFERSDRKKEVLYKLLIPVVVKVKLNDFFPITLKCMILYFVLLFIFD